MTTQKILNKYFLLTILSGVVAFAPQLSQATEIQTFFNGQAVSMDESQDSYLKDLVDNLKTVELSPEYKTALADLKASTSACSSLEEWRRSKPDQSANFIVRKSIVAEDQGTAGPTYSVSLSFPQVSQDSFNIPVQIFSNPSLLTTVSLSKFFKQTLQAVKDAALMNRLNCTRMVNDKKDDSSQKVSWN